VRREIGTAALDRVRVSFTGENAQVARLVVNNMITNYINRTRKEMDKRLHQSESFFQNEVNRSRSKIEELEDRKLTFEIQQSELLPDSPNNLQSTLSDAQLLFGEANEKRDAARLKVIALRKALAATPQTTPSYTIKRNPELLRMEMKLTEQQEILAKYVNIYKMTARHPDLVDLTRQINEIRVDIVSTPPEVISEKKFSENPKHAEIELMLTQATVTMEALTNQTASLTRKLAVMNHSAKQLFPVRAEYNKMEREIEQGLRELAFWEGNLNRVKISLTAEDGERGIQLNFIKPCGELKRPVSPDMLHVLMAAIGMGLMSGAVSVLFAHRTNESFRSGEDLSEAMGVPLIGSVSEIISKQQRRLQKIRRYVIYPMNIAGMSAVLLVLTGMLYFNLKRPETFDQITKHPGQFISSKLQSTGEVKD
jgi:uncharacterized protein involved in exopolysaccharide biosynthesis